ncbi:NAD-dependent dehydratase [Dyadobacter sp. CY312]|uniref:NAD-dependent dehydratase n=1 Tax=Dyadobacter sp. CY312 TaxID=2907303 RepID=UPI001F180FF4|nr:NAD-dependent dehydratase [Dyadobacter sp. CY312]MCE7042942.1 NAD-dependent dehydratase [Dyadobacter sp. CY312]
MMNKNSKIEKKRISILGCGWLGFPLAKRLLQHDITSTVKGSTTSEGKVAILNSVGIEGFLFDLNPHFSAENETISKFFDADSLIISLPPRLSKSEPGHYRQQIEYVVDKIKSSPVKEIILLSSTGIYPDLNKTVTEKDVKLPAESASPEMVEVENLLISLRPDRVVSVLRLAGLIGNDRIPGKYVKGKKDMNTGSIPVNYIHPDDAVGIITTMLTEGVHNETFNVVAPLHPIRKEIYDSTCAQFGWEAPTYLEPEIPEDFKIISGEKLSEYYKYHFKFPDPLHFYYELIS